LGAGATQVSRFLLSNQSLTGRIAGIVVILFAIIMIGSAFTSRGIFGFFSRERRVEVRPSRLGNWAPPVMGAAFGFGWSACIGPILAGVLTIAGTRETVAQGMLLLFVFSMGLGVPFILTGLGLSKAMQAMKSFRKYMRPVNITSGVLMLIFGVLLLTGNVTRLSSILVDIFQSVPFLEELASI
jgi:cytochrome c-type biogenesis protein